MAPIVMNIHEYQAKEILKRYGVPVPVGKVASTLAEVKAAAAYSSSKESISSVSFT